MVTAMLFQIYIIVFDKDVFESLYDGVCRDGFSVDIKFLNNIGKNDSRYDRFKENFLKKLKKRRPGSSGGFN